MTGACELDLLQLGGSWSRIKLILSIQCGIHTCGYSNSSLPQSVSYQPITIVIVLIKIFEFASNGAYTFHRSVVCSNINLNIRLREV